MWSCKSSSNRKLYPHSRQWKPKSPTCSLSTWNYKSSKNRKLCPNNKQWKQRIHICFLAMWGYNSVSNGKLFLQSKQWKQKSSTCSLSTWNYRSPTNRKLCPQNMQWKQRSPICFLENHIEPTHSTWNTTIWQISQEKHSWSVAMWWGRHVQWGKQWRQPLQWLGRQSWFWTSPTGPYTLLRSGVSRCPPPSRSWSVRPRKGSIMCTTVCSYKPTICLEQN